MTKQEVVQRLGKPTQMAAEANAELLGYEWNYAYDTKIGGLWSYVVLIDGKVQRYFNERPKSVSYGMGFNPALIQSQQNINQQINIGR